MDITVVPSDTKEGAFELHQASDPERFRGSWRTHYATVEAAQKAADRFQAALDSLTGNEDADGDFTVKSVPVYGVGRVYADQPGATQYDNGSGRYSIQIWDN